MLQRSLVPAILTLVGVLAYAASTGAQPEAKRAFDFIEQNIEGVKKWNADELKRVAEDLQKLDADWKKLRDNIDGIVLEGQNKYDEATKKLELAVREFESSPDQGVFKRRLHIENLYKLGSLYAEMCDYDKAEERVKRGWAAQQATDGSAKTALASRIRGSLIVAAVLNKCDKPHDAADYVDDCMKWCEQLPTHLYHPEENAMLAACLLVKAEIANSTGQHYAAHEVAARALAMLKATGSKRHPDVAAALHSQSLAAIQLDRTIEVYDPMLEAQAILKDHYVHGHPSLAAVYRTWAQIYFVRGMEPDALKAVEKALTEYQRLFPVEKYPRSHPGLIQAMTSLGDLLRQYGRVDRALELHRDAWQKGERFYPQAHVNKLATLRSHARSLRADGQLRDALLRSQEAEAMARELDARTQGAEGANVAVCLVDRGITEAQLGELPAGLATLAEAVAIYQRLSPPQMSVALQAQGAIYFKQGMAAKARDAFKQALVIDQQALRRFAGIAAEAEALAFRGRGDRSYHAYLSAGPDAEAGDAGYGPVWTAKATVTQVLQKRREITRLVRGKTPEVQKLLERLIDVRTQLGYLIRSARERRALRDKQVEHLGEEKEHLERTLAKQAPALASLTEANVHGPADLAKQLRVGSVFVDLVYYENSLKDGTPQHHYAAFVLAPAGAPMRVDLGPAAPINRAITKWRDSMKHWKRDSKPAQQEEWEQVRDEHAGALRCLVWEPIARCFPPHTRLVYLAPDGDLARFPFAALPGGKPDTLLLEEHLFAHVPHGPFLLEQLLHPPTFADDSGGFLAVGGVDYSLSRRDWGDLPGSLEEINAARRAAGARDAIVLQGRNATSQSVRDALRLTRDAHLATHGFFDEKALAAEHARVARYLQAWRYQADSALPCLGVGRRSPLCYTGLALAGAGKPDAPADDDGILSGETIAELPLDHLRLVVLSACETGLGESTAGEGVQGLQRAFHLAGCPNVVATLWRVDDTATQILMTEFYRQLWDAKKSPLEALWLAQRKVYRDTQMASPNGKPAHAKFWAAFVYSGCGAPLSMNPDDPCFGRIGETSASSVYWAIGGLTVLGIAGAFGAQRWCRPRPPVATILGPADDADAKDIAASS